MACELLYIGGYIDGDRPLFASVADYVAGQPCQIRTDGTLELCTSTDATTFAGIFKNDKREDFAAGPQANDALVTTDVDTGRIVGRNQVRMTPGRLPNGNTQAPFVFPGTAGGGWAVGNEIFNNGSGRWDNQTAGGSLARGRVIKAPASATDDLIVDMYG